MSGPSPTEIIAQWADAAAAAAGAGEVCEENLRALLGPQLGPALIWRQAQESYHVLLDRLAPVGLPLVVKLVVPLAPSVELDVNPPIARHIDRDLDLTTPPSLVVHPPIVRRDWEPLRNTAGR
jgi:hypothetical protein